MRKWSGILTVLLLLAAQVVIWNYFNFSQFVLLTFLPVMILCLPIEVGSVSALFLAFFAGIAVDFFASGVMGLTSIALLPVAFSRKLVITLVFGEEVFSRGENLSVRRQGLFKMNLAIVMSTAVFLLVYIWADGAGTRPFWFNLARFISSLVVSSLSSIPVAAMLTEEDTARWR